MNNQKNLFNISIRSIRDKYLIWSLPSTHNKLDICGMTMPWNYAHKSRKPDLDDGTGHLIHSDHVEKHRLANCRRAECQFCNFEWENDTIKLNENDKPIYNGWIKVRAKSISDKIGEFQHYMREKMKNERSEDVRDFFFNKQKFESKSGKIRNMSLIGNEWNPRSKFNLSSTINRQYRKNKYFRGLNVYHVVLSFRKDVRFESMDSYDYLRKKASKLLIEAGVFGGVMIFHPFRVPSEFNELDHIEVGPHFHFIGFSHIMGDVVTDISKRENVVIINKGEVHNVSGLAQYTLEHAGVSYDEESIKFSLKRYFDLYDQNADLSCDQIKVNLNSLNYTNFLKSPESEFYRELLSDQKSMLKLIHSEIMISKSQKRDRTHPAESIIWIGILGNSKNIIWGYKRPEPEFYCSSCKSYIKKSEIYAVRVYRYEDIGHLSPPWIDDFINSIIGKKIRISPEDIGNYYQSFGNIYRIPSEMVERVNGIRLLRMRFMMLEI